MGSKFIGQLGIMANYKDLVYLYFDLDYVLLHWVFGMTGMRNRCAIDQHLLSSDTHSIHCNYYIYHLWVVCLA